MKKRNLFVIGSIALSLSLFAGCSEQGYDEAPAAAEPEVVEEAAVETQTVALGEHQHSVLCGCAIEEVGTCGNYIQVEDQYVELVLPEESEIGEMAFCGNTDLVATATGEMVDGKFVATSFVLE